MFEQKAVVVIGMHRSGTSAVSGCLSELGVFMGDSLYGPQKGVNEKGFFENSALVEFNEMLLDELTWSWDYPLSQSFSDKKLSLEETLVKKGEKLIRKEYGGRKTIWGMKDPRTSLLLPYWQQVFTGMEITPCYLIMLRQPHEVAGSLKKRDQFSEDKSLMLWLNYTLSSIWNTLDHTFAIVKYDNLLNDTQTVLHQIVDRLSLPVDLENKESSFIDKRLRTQTHGDIKETALSSMSLRLYENLSTWDGNLEVLKNLTLDYQAYCDNFPTVFKEHIESIKLQEVFYRRLFFDAYRSYWWKLSSPLKKMEEFIYKRFRQGL